MHDIAISKEYETRSIFDTLGFIGGIEQIFSTIFGLFLSYYSKFVYTLAAVKKLYKV